MQEKIQKKAKDILRKKTYNLQNRQLNILNMKNSPTNQ